MCCIGVLLFSFIFFFKQKTAYEMRISDWSSDVCSSDLDRLQRLADAESALAGIGQGYLRSLVGHRLFAAEHLPHDRDIVLDAMVGLAPRLHVPSLDDLRPGHAQPDDEAVAAGHRVDGAGDRKSTRLNSCH